MHWALGMSQIYYPEHILGYGRREDLLLSCRGFRLFLDRLIGGGDDGGPYTALRVDLPLLQVELEEYPLCEGFF